MKHIVSDIGLQGPNDTIFVFVDHNYILADENLLKQIFIPNLGNFFKNLKEEFGKLFVLKDSKNLKMVLNGEKNRCFKMKTIDIERQGTGLRSAMKKSMNIFTDSGRRNLGNSKVIDQVGMDNFMRSISGFIKSNFVNSLPDVLPQLEDGQINTVELCNLLCPKGKKESHDAQFVQGVIESQIFHYYCDCNILSNS